MIRKGGRIPVKALKCMVPGCGEDAALRGMCKRCYRAAGRLVRRKKTTWGALEKAGHCRPAYEHRHTALVRAIEN
jgi:hypothetical protein